MNSLPTNQKDIQLYRKLVSLTRKQLAAISENVSRDAGRWDKFIFLYRNAKFKKTILKLLLLKDTRLGDEQKSVAEMMSDLKAIEADTSQWQDITRDELDYIRIMAHGLRDIEDDGEEKKEELTYKLKIPDCH